MKKKIRSALVSVFYKDGLEPLLYQLHDLGVTIYSTGGTQQFIEKLGVPCIPVEELTTYPSILGGRVKTLHPSVFGGILGRRDQATDIAEMMEYKIPEIDLVIVDLYPFEETVARETDEKLIIEKIDIGGPSMIRAAAKNFRDVVVLAAKKDYSLLEQMLRDQQGETNIEQRRDFAALAFEVVAHYDLAIHNYFHPSNEWKLLNQGDQKSLRYGENPHQQAVFWGDWNKIFTQLHGKEISYNNLVDIDAAIQLIGEFKRDQQTPAAGESTFAIIKHTNPCGIASRPSLVEAWRGAVGGDPESAFGGVLICDSTVDPSTAEAINEIFFEVLIAPAYSEQSLSILKTKKNRILLQLTGIAIRRDKMYKGVLNGTLMQDPDIGNYEKWEEVGGRESSQAEKNDLSFANLVAKHLKSNAIALVKDRQLIGKGCGQTSRIDALRQAIAKAKQFGFDLHGAVLASDAFFPFDDCVRIAHADGISAIIQPGGSVRDKDSIEYCKNNKMAMVMTAMRHFRH
ncbi:MAG: bifunctional phosphoribosylaminoimidazolecarboxamide formyltransferase/IMP cyclohydrolase [Chitinophagales bacterium]